VKRDKRRLFWLFGASWLVSSLLIAVLVGFFGHEAASASIDDVKSQAFSPVSYQGEPVPLCRFGVGATGNIADYDIAPLKLGWYVNWTASASPPRPSGSQYMPNIRFQPLGVDSYTYNPSGAQLQQVISDNLGADWLIGNEPDCVWQDNLTPNVYAQAYHELYHLIKAADPTARMFAGGIVQPTSIRLEYLDLVLDSYQELYGEPLPTDGWNIHNFILNENRFDWGAGIPPGIDKDYGEILTIEDNDNFEVFVERIVRFRQWMADRGYRGLPVYLSEYGVQMPADYGSGFPPSRVNAYMTKTFDYLHTTTDPVLGDPFDDYRLVQRWAWWSLSDDSYNGWLFDPSTPHSRTVFGDQWVSYTAQLSPTTNLYPARVFADPLVPHSHGENVTFTLKALVANSGNISSTLPFTVRFYVGDPTDGGVQIGADQVIPSLMGCGGNQVVQMEWADISPGAHIVYVEADPTNNVPEGDETDNLDSVTILVATNRTFLPLIIKK